MGNNSHDTRENNFSLVVAGAKLMPKGTSTLEAETEGLHLAVQAFVRLVGGGLVICPHYYEHVVQQSELSSDILARFKCA